MMHSRFQLTIVVLIAATGSLLLSGSAAVGQVDNNHIPKRFEQLDKYANRLVGSGSVPGVVVLVADNDTVLFEHAYGFAATTPLRKMTSDAIFRIASMTKPITSVGIMMLVEEGKLQLDDSVAELVPELSNPTVFSEPGQPGAAATNDMTIRHLLTHTSGLAYDFDDRIGTLYQTAAIESGVARSSLTLEENLRRLGRLPLRFNPGTEFNYGMSTDVLGLVIERAAKMSLDQFVKKKICDPLGMTDTSFRISKGKRHRLAATFVQHEKQLRQLRHNELIRNDNFRIRMSPDYVTDETHAYLSGGGGMCSTASDYARFCQMILNRGTYNGVKLLREETVKAMTGNRLEGLSGNALGDVTWNFGYGFAVFPDVGGRHHEISWGGAWGTAFRISVGDNWIGIIMTQRATDDSAPEREIAFSRLVRDAMN